MRSLGLIIAGLLFNLIFAPFHFLPAIIPCLWYLLKQLDTPDSRGFRIGWLFGFGYFIGSTYWINNSFLVDIERFWFMIPITISLMPAILAIYIGLIGWTYNKFKRNSITINGLIFASLWFIAEHLRSIVFYGFPWNLSAYSLGASEYLMQGLYYVGIYGMGFLLILASYLLIKLPTKGKIATAIITAIFFTITSLRIDAEQPSSHKSFKIVQPNIPQTLKNNPASQRNNLMKVISLGELVNNEQADFILLPESALPSIVNSDPNMKEILSSFGAEVLTGGLTLDRDPQNPALVKIYNSFISHSENHQITARYNKVKLVPFGEFIPFRKYLPNSINKITPGALDFSQGTRGNNVITSQGSKIRPLICYEAIFPLFVNNFDNADFLVNVTNDAWFGESVGPYQHFEAARFRAVENGISMVRSANSGISGAVDKYGRILESSKLNTEYNNIVKVPIY